MTTYKLNCSYYEEKFRIYLQGNATQNICTLKYCKKMCIENYKFLNGWFITNTLKLFKMDFI